jgi:hypothetical protein
MDSVNGSVARLRYEYECRRVERLAAERREAKALKDLEYEQRRDEFARHREVELNDVLRDIMGGL